MAVIEVEGLHKEYRRLRGGRTLAVDALDLSVPEGGVFGFLGPNGAGKTTTIRCLLGLIRPTLGSAQLLGSDVPADLPNVIRRVGSMAETPALHPRFSGRRNLELLGRIHDIGKRTVNKGPNGTITYTYDDANRRATMASSRTARRVGPALTSLYPSA